ncbi:unnamed protein product [Phaedon cochleariae]|uniref:Uncharacterized protein n=1 Tax=Phaedon cochleariae TaxID=80249 RepID=A0A9N9SC50_PHACE|nr:unnamed protein product [Phaedon cochleariae]
MSTRLSQVKNKKKRKEKVDDNNDELDKIFSELNLKIFCPKKVFDIIFITENNQTSTEYLTNLIKSVKEYEEISCVTFITYEEVLKLLDDFNLDVFPPAFQAVAQEIHQGIKRKSSQNLNSSTWLSQLVKLKLMEVMSHHFLKEISKMEKRNSLEEELASLAQDSKKNTNKNTNKVTAITNANIGEKKSKVKIEAKSSLAIDVGYKLTEKASDIVFDDDIFNHVWFYVFQGFLDAEVLKQLESFNVPIRAVMTFNVSDNISKKSDFSPNHKVFWDLIGDYFDGPHRSINFENTILMKFTATQNNYKNTFEELLYVIKNISDIKLRHLDYIRHIKIHQVEANYKILPLECLLTYNLTSSKIPLELTSEATVLINLLNETSDRMKRIDRVEVEDLWDTISSQTASLTHIDCCKNPFDIEEIFQVKNAATKSFDKPKNTFMVHESDLLTVILKTYRSFGSKFVDSFNDIVRLMNPFNLLKNIKVPSDDFIHKHDIDPSNKLNIKFTKSQLHFLYLFLFSTFKYDEVIEDFEDTDLTENLQTYSRSQFRSSSQPQYENDQSDCEISNLNLYDPSPMAFIWKEELHSQVMIQEIFNNQRMYQYMDMQYSPETENLLVQFSDHLDEFGINTKTYDVTLRTPVCLRDFCKYITVEESKWLEKNKPAKYVRKSEDMEECRGAKNVKKSDLFQEYRHLLDPKAKPDGDTEDIQIDEEENTVTFEEMLTEIQNYPRNSTLIEECGSDVSENFLAYDFGTQYLAIRGTETIFSSHDDVKIRVDNTRMIYEEPKCTVCLTSKGHSLILHSNKAFLGNDYTFHWNLEDGTVVSFILQNQQRKTRRNSLTSSAIDLTVDELTGETDEEQTFLQHAINQKVINLSKAEFEDELEKAENSQIDVTLDEDITNIYKSLKQAIVEECPVYKISDNLTYLMKHENKTEIPLTNIIRRLLHNTKKEVPLASYTKKFIHSTNNIGSSVKSTLDFRVCLPNGLYITCYSSNIRDNLVEIKQEFVTEEERTEEFRLFTRDGYILVKKIDGTITLMKSNGDTISFEKPDSQNTIIRESNLKTCHCKNLDDYRKKLNKMMKDESANDDCYISRRDLFRTKKGYVINKDIAGILKSNKVPYLKTVLLNFDGHRTTLENNKITQKRVYHTTTEQDFLAEEIYFERGDGFQCLFDKNGSQVVRFGDGTEISSAIQVSKDLVDGYVFVSLDFSYQHPDYVTVSYDSHDNLELRFRDVVLERNVEDEIKLKIEDDNITKVNKDTVTFEKICKECDSGYSCSFDISPFRSKNLDYTAPFLHAKDSYDKQFYVDFGGKSGRSKCFLKGPLNRVGCNHTKNNVYKKLFVVNETLSGQQFWSNDMVQTRRLQAVVDADSTIVEKPDIRNPELTTIEFRKKIFDSLAARFKNTALLGEDMCLSKYKKNKNKQECYSTNRALKKMFDIETTKTFLTNLSLQFTEKNKTNASEEAIQDVIKKNDAFVTADVETTRTFEKKQAEAVTEDLVKLCKCIKRKKTFRDKISCWRSECDKFKSMIRQKKIPLYFDSQFCEVIN